MECVMRGAISEKNERILRGLEEVFNVLNEIPPDKSIIVQSDFFGFFAEVLDDVNTDIESHPSITETL